MVQRRVESMGRLDILMNKAGALRIQEVLDITEADRLMPTTLPGRPITSMAGQS